jgi:hypothetical protein
MRRFLRNNGLSLALFVLFCVSFLGQVITGRMEFNEQREEQRLPPVSYGEYLHSGSFLEATMENWESEFLQMFAYVLLTVFLFQRGSAESNDPDDPRPSGTNRSWLYEHSLSLVLFGMFALAFIFHAVGGAEAYNEQAAANHHPNVTAIEYVGMARFWFESFQNWQSEFVSILAMVILSIFLREKGSPESKPVDSSDAATGE